MSDTRAKVTGRVHGVSGDTTKRHTDGYDDHRDRPCAVTTDVDATCVGTDADDEQHEDECADSPPGGS